MAILVSVLTLSGFAYWHLHVSAPASPTLQGVLRNRYEVAYRGEKSLRIERTPMSDLPPLPPRLSAIAAAALPPEPAAAPPLRWAILGAGGIAAKFARDVRRAGSAVVAVGSRTPGKAEAFAQENDVPAYGSYGDVLARDDVDAVYVATTHDTHVDAALQAIAAGKPVLIEKPMTRNSAELSRIREAARRGHVLVMEAMWSRFLPHYAIIRAVVEQKVLGDVTYVRAEFSGRGRGNERLENPDLAGGSLLDIGVYSASFVHWVLGKPEAIRAAGHLTERGVDADVTALLSYPKATAVCHSSIQVGLDNSATIGFEYGRIVLPRDFYGPTELWVTFQEDTGPYQEVWSDEALAGYGFEYEAAAFARALAEGKGEVPGHGWDDAAEVMAILDEMRAQIGLVFPGE